MTNGFYVIAQTYTYTPSEDVMRARFIEETLIPILIVVGILYLVMSGVTGLWIGKHRSRPGAGFWLGLLFGPMGWVLTYFGPDDSPKCPECRGPVVAGARRCRHCAADLPEDLAPEKPAVSGGPAQPLPQKPDLGEKPDLAWKV